MIKSNTELTAEEITEAQVALATRNAEIVTFLTALVTLQSTYLAALAETDPDFRTLAIDTLMVDNTEIWEHFQDHMKTLGVKVPDNEHIVSDPTIVGKVIGTVSTKFTVARDYRKAKAAVKLSLVEGYRAQQARLQESVAARCPVKSSN